MKNTAEGAVWGLNRKYLKDTYTVGVLTIDGQHKFCDTLEDRVRDGNKDGDLDDIGEGKIAGETAIPYGTYQVISYFSPKFQRTVPLLLNVKHFDNIEIHSGNNVSHTAGCILVGDNQRPGHLVNGGYYERKLVEELLKNESRNLRTYIKIT